MSLMEIAVTAGAGLCLAYLAIAVVIWFGEN
jgi:hypothetical protein